MAAESVLGQIRGAVHGALTGIVPEGEKRAQFVRDLAQQDMERARAAGGSPQWVNRDVSPEADWMLRKNRGQLAPSELRSAAANQALEDVDFYAKSGVGKVVTQWLTNKALSGLNMMDWNSQYERKLALETVAPALGSFESVRRGSTLAAENQILKNFDLPYNQAAIDRGADVVAATGAALERTAYSTLERKKSVEASLARSTGGFMKARSYNPTGDELYQLAQKETPWNYGNTPASHNVNPSRFGSSGNAGSYEYGDSDGGMPAWKVQQANADMLEASRAAVRRAQYDLESLATSRRRGYKISPEQLASEREAESVISGYGRQQKSTGVAAVAYGRGRLSGSGAGVEGGLGGASGYDEDKEQRQRERRASREAEREAGRESRQNWRGVPDDEDVGATKRRRYGGEVW
jgi:hypothetical protein